VNVRDLVDPVAGDILAAANQVEADRRLPERLMARLVEAGLFSIYTPRAFGGLELPMPAALRVVEEVSRLDGSTGWTVALGFANAIFTSALPETSAARVLERGSALIAGSPGFAARAEPAAGGFHLSGDWGFCSGVHNATWLGVVVPIVEGGAPLMGEHGPQMIVAFLRPGDVEVLDTWRVSGLRGTGSHDIRAHGVFVPAEMTGGFAIPAGPAAARDSTTLRIPFMTALALAQSPAVCLGIARRALDEFREMALHKERPFAARLSEQVQAQAGLARAEALLRSARAFWYESVDALWDAASAGREISLEDRANVRMACLVAAESSAAAVDAIYRLAGSTSIFEAAGIERYWRDVHAAAQHMQVQDGRWETVGRVLFGLDPESPII
jgi:alkylation response protein AidB-like acyl-CoA dehydrogenase